MRRDSVGHVFSSYDYHLVFLYCEQELLKGSDNFQHFLFFVKTNTRTAATAVCENGQ